MKWTPAHKGCTVNSDAARPISRSGEPVSDLWAAGNGELQSHIMSGHIARSGFQYQDLYLLLRVLRDASGSLDHAWENGVSEVLRVLDGSEVRYGIEASPRANEKTGEVATGGPDWDVLVLTREKFEFAEVKSGAIDKDDRLAFWKRLRRELAARPEESDKVAPILVVDPDKAGDLTKWQELGAASRRFSGPSPSNEPTRNVVTGAQLLNEALWCLCRPDTSARQDDPAVTLAAAQGALSKFELHRHEAKQLDSDVSRLIEILFPGGLAGTEQTLLMGWLGRRATETSTKRRLFAIRELLAEIGILERAAPLTAGTLREWRDLWNEIPQGVVARTNLQLGQTGQSVPAQTVQPAALEALTSQHTKAFVVMGHGGAGKSTFLAQAARSAVQRNDVVLHCGADDVTPEELELLVKAFRFRAAMATIKSSSTRACLLVDGLDEAEPALRRRWAQLLVRLTALPNAYILASVRESVWESDGELRKELECWPNLTLALWPEKLIHDLLEQTPYREKLPSSVISLLRTPILLDLFWRTFVESDLHDVPLAAKLETRHNLLEAYWERRLVRSARYASVGGFTSRLCSLFSQMVREVGPFLATDFDAQVLEALLSEGLLVREGRLQPRLGFRHPLLRDFAFAQWCLATDSAIQVAGRWNSIRGGLQRHGALRALFEALTDENARRDYPRQELRDVAQAIVRTDTNLDGQLAQVLGTLVASDELDPAKWSAELQSSLSAHLGQGLLVAARLAANGSWATQVEHWPDDAAWCGNGYAQEVWNYLSKLQEMLKKSPADRKLREQCRQVARKLRRISEVARFAEEFGNNERWLKMQAMICVIPTLPDETTLRWVEREMAYVSWRTRSCILTSLVYLAPVSPERAVAIYRKAVGLINTKGEYRLAPARQGPAIDRAVIEWSLAGEGERRGLLKEHPVAFLPVALELAEAIWREQHADGESACNSLSDLIKELDPSWTDDTTASRALQKKRHLGGLIDDSLEWSYWRRLPGRDYLQRCLGAIHECAERVAKNSLETFISSIVPALRSSRLASVHSILLDVLLRHHDLKLGTKCIVEFLMDSRLYYVSGMEYWLEQGLIVAWPHASATERTKILQTLAALLGAQGMERMAKNFLLRLPKDDLPVDLREARPAEEDPSHKPYRRPQQIEVTSVEVGSIGDGNERTLGHWPEDFNLETVKAFATATEALPPSDPPIEELSEKLTEAIRAAQVLMRELHMRANLLRDADNWWVWKSLVKVLDQFRILHDHKEAPPEDLVRSCAELAMLVLRDVPSHLPGELPEDDAWTGHRDTEWVCALQLADAALTWPPVVDYEPIQGEFEEMLKQAFETGEPLIQLVCTTTIRPWHWFRGAKRRQLHDQLIWHLPKHASVLTWSLHRISEYSDRDRARVFRLLMNRADVYDSKQLSRRLGRYMGMWSMVVYENGERSAVAELTREAIEDPYEFSLLKIKANLHEFLRSLVFGMKEQAKLMTRHTELAIDYGNWVLRIWSILRSYHPERCESEGVVLIGVHWLEKKERIDGNIATLRIWWQNLQSFLTAIATDGGRADCFALFFNLRDGEYNDLTTPEKLMQLGDIFTQRIRKYAREGSMTLDEIDREQHELNSWRESANYLAETIDSLRHDGSLCSDLQKEQAYHLLSQLASEPVRSPKAIEVLYRLQHE